MKRARADKAPQGATKEAGPDSQVGPDSEVGAETRENGYYRVLQEILDEEIPAKEKTQVFQRLAAAAEKEWAAASERNKREIWEYFMSLRRSADEALWQWSKWEYFRLRLQAEYHGEETNLLTQRANEGSSNSPQFKWKEEMPYPINSFLPPKRGV